MLKIPFEPVIADPSPLSPSTDMKALCRGEGFAAETKVNAPRSMVISASIFQRFTRNLIQTPSSRCHWSCVEFEIRVLSFSFAYGLIIMKSNI